MCYSTQSRLLGASASRLRKRARFACPPVLPPRAEVHAQRAQIARLQYIHERVTLWSLQGSMSG